MKSKKNVAIIGHFGGKENILDGQTVKTKILYDELKSASDFNIIRVDTYYKSKNPVKLMLDSVMSLLRCKDVIVLLSGNGMSFYFPLLCIFAKCFKTRVYHDVIGGNLDSYVEKQLKFKKYLNSFMVNWVETANMACSLEKLGINNTQVLPNFKRLNIVSDIKTDYAEPYSFCMFARVMKEKGVEDAINAIQQINEKYGQTLCRLDIFGRIDDGYKERFEQVMKNASDAIAYKGQVPYEKSVEHIKDYYALLFPTYWNGEGFPGTIVDAFSAGLPVIATDWNCNKELVDNGVNGMIYPSDTARSLTDAVEWFVSNSDKVIDMKKECVQKAHEFMPDKHIERIISYIKNCK